MLAPDQIDHNGGKWSDGVSPLAVAQSTEILCNRWRGARPRERHLVPDAVVLQLVFQAIEFGRILSVSLVHGNTAGSAAIARGLFEVATDLDILASQGFDSEQYDLLGARLRVTEIFQRHQQLSSLGIHADDPSEVVRGEVEAWDLRCPGCGEAMWRALEEISEERKRGKFSWHGRSRSAELREVDQNWGTTRVVDYANLSAMTHPSAPISFISFESALDGPPIEPDSESSFYEDWSLIFSSQVGLENLRIIRLMLSAFSREPDAVSSPTSRTWTLRDLLPCRVKTGLVVMDVLFGYRGPDTSFRSYIRKPGFWSKLAYFARNNA